MPTIKLQKAAPRTAPKGWTRINLGAVVVHPWFAGAVVASFDLDPRESRVLRDGNPLFGRVASVPVTPLLSAGAWTLWDERCEACAVRFERDFHFATGAEAIEDELRARGESARFDPDAVILRSLAVPPARLRDPDLDRLYDDVRSRNRRVAKLAGDALAPDILVRESRRLLAQAVEFLFVNGVASFDMPCTRMRQGDEPTGPYDSLTARLVRRRPGWEIPFERSGVDHVDPSDETLLSALGFEIDGEPRDESITRRSERASRAPLSPAKA